MDHLYFTRHGQTIWNVENKICGATDIALTDAGREQAKALGVEIREKLEKGEIKIDEIWCSPLSRAKNTAQFIADETGIPLKVEQRLIEQNFGRFESTARDGEKFKESKTHFVDSYEGGESMLHLAQRIYNVLDEIKAGDKVILIVAHNGIARSVQSYFFDMTNEEYSRFGIKNCQLLRYEYKD